MKVVIVRFRPMVLTTIIATATALVLPALPAAACNFNVAGKQEYNRAVIAYTHHDYSKAYQGALAAADKARTCLKADDPKQPVTQEEKALWASYLAAAVDAGSKTAGYPKSPTRSELRTLLKTAIAADEEILASPYATELTRVTVRGDLSKDRAFLERL